MTEVENLAYALVLVRTPHTPLNRDDVFSANTIAGIWPTEVVRHWPVVMKLHRIQRRIRLCPHPHASFAIEAIPDLPIRFGAVCGERLETTSLRQFQPITNSQCSRFFRNQ